MRTPLHYAVLNDAFIIAKFIFDNQGDTHKQDHYNKTALDYAEERRNPNIIKLFGNDIGNLGKIPEAEEGLEDDTKPIMAHQLKQFCGKWNSYTTQESGCIIIKSVFNTVAEKSSHRVRTNVECDGDNAAKLFKVDDIIYFLKAMVST